MQPDKPDPGKQIAKAYREWLAANDAQKKNSKQLSGTVGIITILDGGARVDNPHTLGRISNLYAKGFDDLDVEVLTGYQVIRSEYETTTGEPAAPTYRTEFSNS